MKQLTDLAKRLPPNYVSQKPGVNYEAKYCSHGDIQQMLLAKLGPTPQTIVQIIHSSDLKQVQGVILRMSFNIDGETYDIEEIGECERPTDNNALNLKNAVSDGVKRCCMRVSLGLELWTDNYQLDSSLERRGNHVTE